MRMFKFWLCMFIALWVYNLPYIIDIIILFLFGIFSITSALERSGAIDHVVGIVLLRI